MHSVTPAMFMVVEQLRSFLMELLLTTGLTIVLLFIVAGFLLHSPIFVAALVAGLLRPRTKPKPDARRPEPTPQRERGSHTPDAKQHHAMREHARPQPRSYWDEPEEDDHVQ